MNRFITLVFSVLYLSQAVQTFSVLGQSRAGILARQDGIAQALHGVCPTECDPWIAYTTNCTTSQDTACLCSDAFMTKTAACYSCVVKLVSSGGAASNRYLAEFPTDVRDGLDDLYDRCSSTGYPISKPDLDASGVSGVDTTVSVASVKNGSKEFAPVSYMLAVGALGCAIAGLSV